MAGFTEFLTGSPAQQQQLPRYTPEQQQFMQQQLQQASTDFSPDALEKRARNQFHSQTLPSIAERFTAFGPGAQRSSAFQGALGSASADLETGLAALRSQYGLQKAQLGLQPTFENIYLPGTTGLIGGAAQGIGQGLGSTISGLAGGGQNGLFSLFSQFLQWLQGNGQQKSGGL